MLSITKLQASLVKNYAESLSILPTSFLYIHSIYSFQNIPCTEFCSLPALRFPITIRTSDSLSLHLVLVPLIYSLLIILSLLTKTRWQISWLYTCYSRQVTLSCTYRSILLSMSPFQRSLFREIWSESIHLTVQ